MVMDTVESEFLLNSRSSISPNFTNSSELTVLEIVSGITSEVTCASILLTLLIVVVCIYKAYKTTLHRLILYHNIFSLLCELSLIIFSLVSLSDQLNLLTCKVVVYFSLYFIQLWVVYTTVVTNCLFIFTLCLMRGSPRFWRHGKVVECSCICLTVLVPMMYIWLQIIDEHNVCEKILMMPSKEYKVGVIIDIVYVVLCTESLLVCVAMCSLFCFLRRRLRNGQLTNLLKHLLYLTVTNAALVIFAALLTVNLYYLYLNHPLESLHTTISYVSGVGLPVLVLTSAVVLLPLAVRSESCKCMCNKSCFKRHRKVRLDLPANESQNETNPSSHPLNQPSHTYFSIPYTGEFTQVTLNKHCSESDGERTPLIVVHHNSVTTE